MHPAVTAIIVKEVRQRISEGDCPSIRARTTEDLEGAIEDLAGRLESALKGEPAHYDRGNYEDRHPNDMVLHPLTEIREWDEALAVLGIQDGDQTPADAIRELKAEINRLRDEASYADLRASGGIVNAP